MWFRDVTTPLVTPRSLLSCVVPVCAKSMLSDHLVVTAGWPFCGSDKKIAPGPPPPPLRSQGQKAIYTILIVHSHFSRTTREITSTGCYDPTPLPGGSCLRTAAVYVAVFMNLNLRKIFFVFSRTTRETTSTGCYGGTRRGRMRRAAGGRSGAGPRDPPAPTKTSPATPTTRHPARARWRSTLRTWRIPPLSPCKTLWLWTTSLDRAPCLGPRMYSLCCCF